MDWCFVFHFNMCSFSVHNLVSVSDSRFVGVSCCDSNALALDRLVDIFDLRCVVDCDADSFPIHNPVNITESWSVVILDGNSDTFPIHRSVDVTDSSVGFYCDSGTFTFHNSVNVSDLRFDSDPVSDSFSFHDSPPEQEAGCVSTTKNLSRPFDKWLFNSIFDFFTIDYLPSDPCDAQLESVPNTPTVNDFVTVHFFRSTDSVLDSFSIDNSVEIFAFTIKPAASNLS